MRGGLADVFISYKREDRDRIGSLARALESRGYTVWWDLELVAGQKWAKKIKAELDSAKCVVVAWTRASINDDRTYVSEWVENEADEALRRGVLVPVLIDEGRIAWTHQKVQYATLIGWNGEPDHPGLSALVDGVVQHAGLRAKPQQIELAAWSAAERDETAEAFQEFVAAYPQSRFANIARGRTAELSEAADWALLGRAPTVAALAGFLQSHPAGRFADETKTRISALELAKTREARQSELSSQAGANAALPARFDLGRWMVGAGTAALALIAVSVWSPWKNDSTEREDPASPEPSEEGARSALPTAESVPPTLATATSSALARITERQWSSYFADQLVRLALQDSSPASLRAAANAGDARAQTILGICFRLGACGVSASDAEAASWYRRAAEQGFPRAQFHLAAAFEEGRGVVRDDSAAVSWMRRAAEQGCGVAQADLAQRYEYGRGVTINRVEAIRWSRLAAEQGAEGARLNLERLEGLQ